MRALIWQLKPVGLENGLISAIKQYSQFIHVESEFEVEGLIDLPNTIEENVYRIIQESLNNIKKHSGTHHANIYMEQNKLQFKVVIIDEGIGFESSKTEKTVSNGLRNMKQRAQVMKGHIEVSSSTNKGTKIELTIPL